jgi:malate synthase
VHNGARLDDGTVIDADLVRRIEDDELAKLRQTYGDELYGSGRFEEARRVFEQVALADDFVEFLTLPAYDLID